MQRPGMTSSAIDGELFDQIEDDVGLIRGLAWQIS